MKRAFLTVLFILSGLVVAALAQAPGGRGRGMGMGPYDPKAETTITGTVQAVQQHPGRRGNMGIHLLLKTTDTTLDVHVGPTWYIDKQGFAFAEGDTVEVVGSMLKTNDGVLAREIKKGEKTLTLRNEAGRPLWAGRNKG